MADPSRQISESGGRNNPPRRRSAEERHEVDNEANNEANNEVDNEAPIDANNNARRNLDVDTPSPDSQIVTSTTPEDLDSNRETVRASSGLSSEATPPSSVESPSLEEDLPPADSPENREVTSTSNLNPHSTTTSPPIHRGLAGMSIEESRLNAERNANEIASSSGHISSSNQEIPRSRRDQNINVQNPTQGVGRSSAASDECPISIVCRQILNSPSVTTASGPPVLQRQPAASSSQQPTTSMGLLEYLINSPPVTTLAPLPARFMYCGNRPSGPRMAARITTSSNRPIMSVPVTTSVINPLTRASVHSSNRPPPLIPSSTNRPFSSFSTAPNIPKQPVQSSSTRPAFLPSSSKSKAMSPNNPSFAPTSTRPQSPVPFSVKQPPTLVSIASSISYNPATSSTSPVQTSATMSTSGFSSNRPIAPCLSTRHPSPAHVLRPPAFASSSASSSLSPTSSSSKSSIAPASSSQTKPQASSSSKSNVAHASSSQTKPPAQASSSSMSSIAPASSSQTKPSAQASSSSKSSIAPASSSQTKPQASSSSTKHPVPEPTTRFPIPGTSTSARPSVPDSSLSMHVKQAASSKPLTSCTEKPKKVVTTSASLKSSDHAQTSTTQLQKPLSVSSQSTSSVLAKRTKEALKTVNVPKVSTNPSSSSSKCPQSRTKSPIKSPIKRQANPPTQEISDDIDNTLSPIKRLKIVSKVGEGSKQSEKNGSSQRAAEAECEVMDDDSVLEIASSEKNESEDENSN